MAEVLKLYIFGILMMSTFRSKH